MSSPKRYLFAQSSGRALEEEAGYRVALTLVVCGNYQTVLCQPTCESHSKSSKVIVDGLERRFCQQCSSKSVKISFKFEVIFVKSRGVS
ncbi:hypothetical protein CJ030_MR7G011790 [Morella rubra]|uniref:SBP-type domain-containing protein n=1 Tax=Morella rubra TaxID=262757 RepID=A0A6A1V358_9ROSI|nr:hypothetical protein CJ030_MR7G011790 [Morella rubra]